MLKNTFPKYLNNYSRCLKNFKLKKITNAVDKVLYFFKKKIFKKIEFNMLQIKYSEIKLQQFCQSFLQLYK